MSDLEYLKSLFNKGALISLDKPFKKWQVCLTEANTGDSQVIIKNLPAETVIIALDSNFTNEKIFSGAKGECSRCDYILFFEEDNELNIVYIELKKNKLKNEKVICQLKGASAFAAYCRAIGQNFFDKGFMAAYREYFIAFNKTARITKKPTRYKTMKNNSTPENFLRIDYPSSKGVFLKELLR